MNDPAASISFDLIDVARALWQRKTFILGAGLLGVAVALMLSAAIPREYQAEGSIVVRAPALTSTDSDAAFGAGVVNEAVVETEQGVLMDPGLLDRVADGVAIPAALLHRRSLTERLGDLLHTAAGRLGPRAQAWIDTVYAAVFPPQPVLSEQEQRRKFIRSALSVSADKNSSVINVHAVTPVPQVSADTVNSALKIYMDDRAAEQNRTATLIEAALTERLQQIKQQIAERQDEITRLMKQPGVIDNSEVPGEMRAIALVGSQLAQAEADLARRQAEYTSATQVKGGRAFSAPDSTAISDMRRMLAEQEGNYARLSAQYGPNYPGTQAAQRQVAALQAQVAAEGNRGVEQKKSDLAAAKATVDSLHKQLDQLRSDREAATGQTLELDRQKEQLASLWRISDVLQTRMIDIMARPTNLNARVLSEASVPTLAAFPKRSFYALGGFVVAIALAMGFVVVRSHLARQNQLPFQLALQLNVPLLGGLPRISGRNTQRRLVDSGIYTPRADAIGATLSSVAVEVENIVRRGDLRCLMITSAQPGEGKTTVAIALGRWLAANGLRVLLVDLDLRRPSVEQVFVGSVRRTLSDDTCSLDDRVIDIRVDDASGIHLFTPKPVVAGTDPLRLLRSADLNAIIEQVRSRYDLVLFDTPPVMLLPDALVVAEKMDSLLLVTELGRNQEPGMDEFSRRLARTGKPICGVIVTKVKAESAYREAY